MFRICFAINEHSILKYLCFCSPRERSRVMDTWMGDPTKLRLFLNIINIIEKNNLLENVRKTGEILKNGLGELEYRYYDLIHSTRGHGIFLGFSAQCPKYRDYLHVKLRNKGESTTEYQIVNLLQRII